MSWRKASSKAKRRDFTASNGTRMAMNSTGEMIISFILLVYANNSFLINHQNYVDHYTIIQFRPNFVGGVDPF